MNVWLSNFKSLNAYVLSRYAKLDDVVQLNWLPLKKLMEFNTSKIVNKSYLDVEFQFPRRNLRSGSREPMVKLLGNGTFQNQARYYNDIPENIKADLSIKNFNKESKKFYLDKATARALSL